MRWPKDAWDRRNSILGRPISKTNREPASASTDAKAWLGTFRVEPRRFHITKAVPHANRAGLSSRVTRSNSPGYSRRALLPWKPGQQIVFRTCSENRVNRFNRLRSCSWRSRSDMGHADCSQGWRRIPRPPKSVPDSCEFSKGFFWPPPKLRRWQREFDFHSCTRSRRDRPECSPAESSVVSQSERASRPGFLGVAESFLKNPARQRNDEGLEMPKELTECDGVSDAKQEGEVQTHQHGEVPSQEQNVSQLWWSG